MLSESPNCYWKRAGYRNRRRLIEWEVLKENREERE
jgi:hypothetical protein